MRGEDVRLLQQKLNKLCFSIEDRDSFFGKTTRRAIQEIQKKHGIKETGIVDEVTAERIKVAAMQLKGFSVRGTVKRSDGASLAGLTVNAVDWDIVGENQLGSTATGSDGSYEIYI